MYTLYISVLREAQGDCLIFLKLTVGSVIENNTGVCWGIFDELLLQPLLTPGTVLMSPSWFRLKVVYHFCTFNKSLLLPA
jgi:hypothetical protein